MNKVRVAIVGCGSVSGAYIPHLKSSAYVDLVAVCDTLPGRAQSHAQTYQIAHYFTDIDQMLRDVDFDLLVNITPMQLHGPFNRKALEAGRHVWCEKPLATDLTEAQALLELARNRGVNLWGAPSSPISPAFQQMAKIIASGDIGPVFAAHGLYGSPGPDWEGSGWFYQKGGGVLFDLGVYNITTLTALLGPVQSVVAMAGTAIPQRVVGSKTVDAEAVDNTALVLDHGNTVYSVIQNGFVYGAQREDWTIQVLGTKGAMTLGGYDWEPRNVSVLAHGHASNQWTTTPYKRSDYVWECGATYVAECLAKREKPLLTGEHAAHVLDVMLSALKAAETGQRVQLQSTFSWPLGH